MRPDIAEQLRLAIRDCGLSENKLAEKTKVQQPVINRFMNGADMRMSSAAKIARFLKLDLKRR